MRTFLGVLFVCVGLVACGGDLDISTNASNVCSEIAKVACHNLYRCCAEGEIEQFLGVDEPRTQKQCESDVRLRCERSIARLDAAVEEKRARFDSSTMNSCLEALAAPDGGCVSVETALPWTEECMNSAWVGLVADGGQCFGTVECASADSFCAANQTCTARPTTGQPCTGVCARGNFCQAGTCQPQLVEGQPCTSTIQCQTSLFCDFSAVQAVCTAVRDSGQPCTSDSGCKSGDCIPGTCAGSTTSCFTDANCSRRCTNTGNICTQDGNCGPGTCSITTTTTCTLVNNPCTLLGETCVFPPLCAAGDCVGDPVCSTAQVVVDYCEGAIEAIPIP